ncbi:unnamed protein product [Sphacelaria rigidula]
MMPSTNNPVPAPVRLAPIIRAPEREANSTHRRVQHKQPSVKQEPVFTVYVNSAECKHSADLMREIRDVHNVPCTVIDVADGVNIPTWLRGTPSIVVGTEVYCGDTAFDFVASVGADHGQQPSPDSQSDQTSSFQNIVSGESSKNRNDGIGCGLSTAFSPPVRISDEEAEKKYSVSVDDVMTRLMQSRG